MKAQIAHARTTELRKTYRYRLSAPVFFCWVAPNGAPESGDGMTRDIDTTGAFINTMELPPVGARVQMDIMLPNILGGELGAHLTGEGVVIRVEPNNGKAPGASESGFEVSMQFYVESSESVLSHLKRSERLM
jgi:hypothetical protein